MISTDFFDHLDKAIKSRHPFVLFSKPEHRSLKSYIQTNTETYRIDDYSESGFVFAPFDSAKDSFYIPLENSMVIELEHLDFDAKFKPNHLDRIEPVDDHLKLVSTAIDTINTTDLEKVVLSRAFKFNLQSSNPIEIFKSLAQTYPSAFTYCWFHPQTGFWFGASPESLLKLEGRSLTTMALAGTQTFNPAKDIEWDIKNKDEHAFVTDYLVDVLSNYLEPIKTSGPHTLRAGELLHLQTHITGRLKSTDYSLKELLRAMHPTPAVCGTPRQMALEYVFLNEAYDREFYAGFFGELNVPTEQTFRNSKKNIENRAYQPNRKSTHLAVNLRCMKLDGYLATLYSGGGITKNSDPLTECIEIQNKIQTIKKVL
ncbi:chorismate-binding protein [Flavobacteriaceae bacterium]|nr:chorismate-binding protein [Flavobacteriaceae bacterium]